MKKIEPRVVETMHDMIRSGFDAALIALIKDALADRIPPSVAAIDKMMTMLQKMHPQSIYDLCETGIVHLQSGTNRAKTICNLDTDGDNLAGDHNDITCPMCFCIHEAVCERQDDESVFYGQDIDSIIATNSFIEECLSRIAQRLAFKVKR